MKIGNIELENNIILAPMAGITNLGYRLFMKEFGCGLVVSEMISDYALIYNNKETVEMLKTMPEEVSNNEKSYTGKYLKKILSRDKERMKR